MRKGPLTRCLEVKKFNASKKKGREEGVKKEGVLKTVWGKRLGAAGSITFGRRGGGHMGGGKV